MRRRPAFTLIEIIMAVSIFSALILAGMVAIKALTSSQQSVFGGLAINQSLRSITEEIRGDIRAANGSQQYPQLGGTYAAIVDASQAPADPASIVTYQFDTAESPVRSPLLLVQSKEGLAPGLETLTVTRYFRTEIPNASSDTYAGQSDDNGDGNLAIGAIFREITTYTQTTSPAGPTPTGSGNAQQIVSTTNFLPGTPYYPIKNQFRRERLTPASLDIASFELSGMPASCPRPLTADETARVEGGKSSLDASSRHLFFFMPPLFQTLPGGKPAYSIGGFALTDPGSFRWVGYYFDPNTTNPEADPRWLSLSNASGMSPSNFLDTIDSGDGSAAPIADQRLTGRCLDNGSNQVHVKISARQSLRKAVAGSATSETLTAAEKRDQTVEFDTTAAHTAERY